MRLEDKVGQLFMFGFQGLSPGPEVEELLARCRPAGVIYFGRNLTDPAQGRALSDGLQALAHSLDMPRLLVAADQEGGPVLRLRHQATPIPAAMAMGATRDPRLVHEAACLVARELLAAGINMNLAPVLDVNNNPANPVIGVRSYGSDPQDVARFGAAAVAGYQEAGVLATAKHFPGHGDTHVDSHLDLPTIAHGRQRLNEVELLPFVAAVNAGVAAVMPAHIVYPALDPGRPATVSEAMLEGVLRTEIGFKGLVVTDCMEMAAISSYLGTARAAVLAVAAGADLVLISHTPAVQFEAYNAVLAAVRDGTIPTARVDEAVGRVLRCKEALPDDLPAPGEAGDARSLAWARRLFARTITLVRAGAPFPARGEVLVTVVDPGAGSQVEDQVGSPLARALSSHYLVREVAPDRLSDWPRDLPVVVGTRNLHLRPELGGLVSRIARRHPAAVVAMQSPYDLLTCGEVETYLCAYSAHPFALAAVADVLAGEEPGGTLPVELPGLYPRGHRATWG